MTTEMQRSSQNSFKPVQMALGMMTRWLNLFLHLIRYILSFAAQCRILSSRNAPEQQQYPEQSSIAYQNSLSSSISNDEYMVNQLLIKHPGEYSKAKLQIAKNSSADHIFGPYTKELLFGKQQTEYRQSSDSTSQSDNASTFEYMKRESMARSLTNLINRLEVSASLETMPNLGNVLNSVEQINLNKTPSSEPCSTIRKSESFSRRNSAVINLRNCRSQVVNNVVRKLRMKVTADVTRDWDVYWTSNQISVMRCKTFAKHQRTNHFPESSKPLLKNNLAKYLTRMSVKYPKEYDFFPESWCLPEETSRLIGHTRNQPNDWYIVKPHNGSSGHGIFITRDTKELTSCGKMVCQVYIQRPLLIDGYKFDLRIYVLVTSCKPLRIFVYNEGFARLCTETYQAPSRRNSSSRRTHLTNYSVNKYSAKCVVDDAKGTLRKLSAFNDWLTENNRDAKSVTDSMDDVIIKTTISFTPVLSHYYYMSFPEQTESNSCFQIFGFDIMLDENYKPCVLEVNTDPSLYADVQMEQKLKEELVFDTFNILNLTKKPKKTVWLSSPKSRCEKLLDDRKLTLSRIQWENSHMGNYRKVYPNQNMAYYEELLKAAERIALSV